MKKDIDLLIAGAAQVLSLDERQSACAKSDAEAAELGTIEDGAVAISAGRIVEVGRARELQAKYEPRERFDAKGGVVSPGLIDPHTHLVFAGSRHREYGLRLRGATYREILEAGGGIHSTVEATRAATEEELVELALPRLAAHRSFGATTIEVKSGYGLDVETELKMLRAIKKLGERQPVRLVPTYLGGHVVPREFLTRRGEYVRLMIEKVIPQVAGEGLAEACDVYVDEGAFSLGEGRLILEAASAAGLRPKIHAGQFSDQGGAELIAELGGLSADHLECISDQGIAAMARAGAVANLLPGAAFSLRSKFPNGRRLIDAGVKVAVATDDNPGTSRTENLPLLGAMAATQMGLTASEAWKAMTVHAAKALGKEASIGALKPGMLADIAIFSIPDFRVFLYHFGTNHLITTVIGGRIIA